MVLGVGMLGKSGHGIILYTGVVASQLDTSYLSACKNMTILSLINSLIDLWKKKVISLISSIKYIVQCHLIINNKNSAKL